MSTPAMFQARIMKESKMFTFNPPPGVCVYPVNGSLYEYKAGRIMEKEAELFSEITGPEDSPYEGGIFELDLSVTDRYPFEPPKLRFITPIYHPNIDSTGRICLDLLKMPPAGNWQPSINICVLLTSLRLLMASPNPLDPLMVDISEEYLKNNTLFVKKAKEKTQAHAMKQSTRKEGVESKSSSPTPALIKEISNKKEKLDVNSELSRKQIDDNNQVESKRRKLEETVESETSRSSDSSEADWSD